MCIRGLPCGAVRGTEVDAIVPGSHDSVTAEEDCIPPGAAGVRMTLALQESTMDAQTLHNTKPSLMPLL